MKTITVELKTDDALALLKRMERDNIIRLLESTEEMAVSEAHQELVMQRLENVRKNPELLLGWDDAKQKLIS
jgi:hypothetical protein